MLERALVRHDGTGEANHRSLAHRAPHRQLADIIAVDTDPSSDVRAVENVRFLMKDGQVYKIAA